MMLSDLPDDVFCCIFDFLDVADMRKAALVCQRWSKLVFFGRRMDRVLLKPKPDECSVLMKSNRRYRNIFLKFFDAIAPIFDEGMPEKILHKFGLSISSLRIESEYNVTRAMLRKFLLEVPNLQELTIKMHLSADDTKTFESFPALAKLKYLDLNCIHKSDMPLFRDALNLPINSPRLEQLLLSADGGAFFNILEHFSPQLKVVEVDEVSEQLFLQNFPRLRELHLLNVKMTTPQLILDFFRRHSSIQELAIYVAIPRDLFHIITSHCRNITYLGLTTSNLQQGDCKCLDQLTKLRHLELFYNAEYGVDYFYGCGVIPSLEKISTNHINYFDHWNLLTLKQVATQLKCLRFSKVNFNVCKDKLFDMIGEYSSHIDSVILEYCWDQEQLLKLIDHVKEYRELWCKSNKHYRNKNKQESAWLGVGKKMGIDMQNAKYNWTALLNNFRVYRARVKRSQVTGSGQDDIYRPSWFAYEAMLFVNESSDESESHRDSIASARPTLSQFASAVLHSSPHEEQDLQNSSPVSPNRAPSHPASSTPTTRQGTQGVRDENNNQIGTILQTLEGIAEQHRQRSTSIRMGDDVANWLDRIDSRYRTLASARLYEAMYSIETEINELNETTSYQ